MGHFAARIPAAAYRGEVLKARCPSIVVMTVIAPPMLTTSIAEAEVGGLRSARETAGAQFEDARRDPVTNKDGHQVRAPGLGRGDALRFSVIKHQNDTTFRLTAREPLGEGWQALWRVKTPTANWVIAADTTFGEPFGSVIRGGFGQCEDVPSALSNHGRTITVTVPRTCFPAPNRARVGSVLGTNFRGDYYVDDALMKGEARHDGIRLFIQPSKRVSLAPR